MTSASKNIVLVIISIFVFALSQNLHAQILHVNTINCKLSNSDTALLNKMARFEANFYNQVFQTHLNDTVTININLYGKKGEYKDVQKDEMKTTFIDGFYSAKDNKIFIYKSDEYMKTLFHETSHNLLHYNFARPPQWLNEGIATLLGYLVETTDHRILYMPQKQYIKMVRDSMRLRTFSFNNFFNYQPNDWYNKDKRPMLYATSYTIIYFLINQESKDYLAPMLVLMKKGYSTQRAFKEVFGSVDEFTSQFFEFYRTGYGTQM